MSIESCKSIAVQNNSKTWLILRLKKINGDDSSFPIKSGGKIEMPLFNFGTAWLEYGDIESEFDVKVILGG
jgi:hypothetical protein